MAAMNGIYAPEAPPDTEYVLSDLWRKASEEINQIQPETENWKIQTLPLARVKKIMKAEEFVMAELDKDRQKAEGILPEGEEPKSNVKFMIAADAPIVLSRACEFLIREITCRAWQHTERNRRRTLQRQDLHAAVSESEVFDFLIDIVPRVTTSARPGLPSPEAVFNAMAAHHQPATNALTQPATTALGGGTDSTHQMDPTGGMEPTPVVGQPAYGIPPVMTAPSPPMGHANSLPIGGQDHNQRQQTAQTVVVKQEQAVRDGANAVAPTTTAVWQDRLPHEQTNET